MRSRSRTCFQSAATWSWAWNFCTLSCGLFDFYLGGRLIARLVDRSTDSIPRVEWNRRKLKLKFYGCEKSNLTLIEFLINRLQSASSSDEAFDVRSNSERWEALFVNGWTRERERESEQTRQKVQERFPIQHLAGERTRTDFSTKNSLIIWFPRRWKTRQPDHGDPDKQNDKHEEVESGEKGGDRKALKKHSGQEDNRRLGKESIPILW